MKKIILSTTVLALLLFTGCGSAPTIDETQENATDANAQDANANNSETIASDETVIDENSNANADSNEMTMSGLEGKMQTVTFEFDKFKVQANQVEKVEANVELAQGDANTYMIKLEGNCDEWGSDEYNYALGLKRAKTIKQTMISKGVNASRITMVSYGESNPTCTDKSESCWSNNRRVDFKLLP